MRVAAGDSWFVGPAEASRRYELLVLAADNGDGEVWRARGVDAAGAESQYAITILDAEDSDGWRSRIHPAPADVREVFLAPARGDSTRQRLYVVRAWIAGSGMHEALQAGALRGPDVPSDQHPPPSVDYPMPPSVHPASGGSPWIFPGAPAVPPRKKRTGLIVGLAVVLPLLLVLGCCAFLSFSSSESDRTDVLAASPTRSVDRSTPPPAADVIARALVTPEDALAATGSRVDSTATWPPDRVVTLSPFQLCDTGSVAGDGIGSQDANGLGIVGVEDAVGISSAVAGFYGRYSAEYFGQVRAHAQECGWQEFSVPALGDESFAAFGHTATINEATAVIVVRSGQSVLVLAVDAHQKSVSYQRYAVAMATRMAPRLPKSDK
ncbi:hypothetical protein [Cryptosporangium aurantiacum]|nr:hypothetical protein [Cryptosporangium aurantiacum]